MLLFLLFVVVCCCLFVVGSDDDGVVATGSVTFDVAVAIGSGYKSMLRLLSLKTRLLQQE